MATVSKHLPPVEEIEYPETDGQPMGETDYHIAAMIDLRLVLQHYFRQQKVYVATDLFLYYEKGNPRAVKAPDVMVVKGVDSHFRKIFKTWEEKAHPCVVLEITSEKMIDEDRGPKRDLYARLGVAEYFLFDPTAEALDPTLQGYRLKGKGYVGLKPARDGSLTSKELGLRLRAEGHVLRLTDAKTGRLLLTPEEEAEQERQRAEQEKQRADTLAAEVERLREELRRREGK
jgi:Uma2 family endonuclease